MFRPFRLESGARVTAAIPNGAMVEDQETLVSFRLLPSVQEVKPDEPYDDGCLADVHNTPQMPMHRSPGSMKSDFVSVKSMKSDFKAETGSVSSWLPSSLPRRVSGHFQQLLNQLAQQHALELELCRKNKLPTEAESPVDHKNSVQTLRSRMSAASGGATEQLTEVRRHRNSGQTSTTSTQLLLRNRQHIPVIAAEQILPAFSGEASEQVVSNTTSEQNALTEFFSETESMILKRYKKLSQWEKIRWWLQSNQFEMFISGALCLNIIWMAFELQIAGHVIGYELGTFKYCLISREQYESWERAFGLIDALFALFFGGEVIIRMLLLGFTFWRSCLNYIDVAVSIISVIEMFVFMTPTLGVNPVLFRLLRMGKLSRAMRVVSMTSVLASLQLLLKCLAASRDMLFWSFLLLTFVQCVAGMVVTTLCWQFIQDESQEVQLRDEVFRYYGTFTRTFLSMFEIMFANWSPPCRVLVEHVSEWFSIFFLLYRCVLGFAVLNVVNAVFVQQTMKTASSDEDLAFKQKEKDIAMYNRKVKKLFATMDSSGDGAINFEEFSKLVKSPKLRFWMSQLELEYHDLLSLFEFLDNGDGQITLHEFIDGAARLRGSAKAIDVWRMETKVEVLFEEVLNYLDRLREKEEEASSETLADASPRHSSIQEIFNQSAFRHIKATTFISQEAPEEDAMDSSHRTVSRSPKRSG